MRNLVAMLFAAMTLVATPAIAADQARVKAAADLLEAMQMERMLDQMVGQIDGMVKQQMAGLIGELDKPEFKPAMDKYSEGLQEVIAELMKWDTMRDAMAQIYAEVYTVEELNEVAKFYRTPTGTKFVQKMPQLMQSSMTVMQGQMQQLMPKVMELAQQLQKDLEAAKK